MAGSDEFFFFWPFLCGFFSRLRPAASLLFLWMMALPPSNFFYPLDRELDAPAVRGLMSGTPNPFPLFQSPSSGPVP